MACLRLDPTADKSRELASQKAPLTHAPGGVQTLPLPLYIRLGSTLHPTQAPSRPRGASPSALPPPEEVKAIDIVFSPPVLQTILYRRRLSPHSPSPSAMSYYRGTYNQHPPRQKTPPPPPKTQPSAPAKHVQKGFAPQQSSAAAAAAAAGSTSGAGTYHSAAGAGIAQAVYGKK